MISNNILPVFEKMPKFNCPRDTFAPHTRHRSDCNESSHLQGELRAQNGKFGGDRCCNVGCPEVVLMWVLSVGGKTTAPGKSRMFILFFSCFVSANARAESCQCCIYRQQPCAVSTEGTEWNLLVTRRLASVLICSQSNVHHGTCEVFHNNTPEIRYVLSLVVTKYCLYTWKNTNFDPVLVSTVNQSTKLVCTQLLHMHIMHNRYVKRQKLIVSLASIQK